MTPAQVRYAASKYAARLGGMGVRPSCAPLVAAGLPAAAQLGHAMWMCSELEGMSERGEMSSAHAVEKAMRWLGFVQGVLWAAGVYSVDDMKDDNRSSKVRSVPPADGG